MVLIVPLEYLLLLRDNPIALNASVNIAGNLSETHHNQREGALRVKVIGYAVRSKVNEDCACEMG